jgi:predicted transcriptional regulator
MEDIKAKQAAMTARLKEQILADEKKVLAVFEELISTYPDSIKKEFDEVPDLISEEFKKILKKDIFKDIE